MATSTQAAAPPLPAADGTHWLAGLAPNSKLTEEVIATLCDHIAAGKDIITACAKAGISERTYYGWKARGETGEEPFCRFCSAIKRAESALIDRTTKHIEDAATDGSWQAAAWILERRFPHKFGRHQPQPVVVAPSAKGDDEHITEIAKIDEDGNEVVVSRVVTRTAKP